MGLKALAKVLLFPIYVPYKLLKDAADKPLPADVQEHLKGDTAQYLMGYGIKPEDAMKLSEEFWAKNRNKLKEALRC
jgi:hypothetical protein